MLIALPKNAATKPATRLAIAQSTDSDYEVAAHYGVSRNTVRKWRARDSVADGSHTPHRMQTTLNAGQEQLVIYLRRQLRLSLDDLLAVVREFIHPQMSRSALDRLLRRRGESRLPEPDKPTAAGQPFKASEPGFVHVDVKYLPQMADEQSRCCVFVAINRATTRWVLISIAEARTAAAARYFLKDLASEPPFTIETALTDDGTEFTDHLFGSRAKEPNGDHEFDRLCEALDIEHRLTRVRSPQTTDMVEPFNGRLEQIL